MWHGVVVSHVSTTSTLAINIGYALPGGLVICYYQLNLQQLCVLEVNFLFSQFFLINIFYYFVKNNKIQN